MLSKVFLYFKKYGLFILIGIICFIAIICAIFSFINKRAVNKVAEKTEEVIDKTLSQITQASIEIKEIDIKKNIKLEQNEVKKKIFENQMAEISKIEDKYYRLESLIDLNKSIKVKL